MKPLKWQGLVFFFIVFLLAGIILMKSIQAQLRGTTMILGVDIYPRWIGSLAALSRESPYTIETRQEIWMAIYGNTSIPAGNPFGFYYPPAIITLLAPFILAGLPIEAAARLWCAFLWALFSTFLVLWVATISNRAKARFILPLLLLTGWFFRPAFSNYILGQFALFSVLMVIAAWLSFQGGKPALAGLFCALALVKPSLTILPIILLFILYRQNRNGLASFLIVFMLLNLPPTILLGWWLPDFLHDISRYTSENQVAWSSVDLNTLSGLLWLFLSISLTIVGLRTKDNALSLSSVLALNTIFVPHTADYDLVAFIPLLVYAGYRWLFDQKQNVLLTAFFFALCWFPWLSLIFFLLREQGSPYTVEAWYRFIWLTYPALVLFSVFLTELRLVRSSLHQIKERINSYQAS